MNELRYTLSIAEKSFKSKPKRNQIAGIKNLLTTKELTLQQLATYLVQPYSYSFTPAIFKADSTTKDSNTWCGQQCFFLDFDKNTKYNDVNDRLQQVGIKTNLYYTTFRHTEAAPRFRVGIMVDELITDPHVAASIRWGLKKLFPDADSNCFDAPRLFHGGLTAQVINEEPNKLNELITITDLLTIEADKGRTRKLSKNGDGEVGSIVYSSDNGILPKTAPFYKFLKSLSNNPIDWDLVASRVRIFREFMNGDFLYNPQLFGLACSLHWMRSGKILFNQTMDKFNDMGLTNYSKEKFYMIQYASHREYLPMALEKYSPYPEDWRWGNLALAAKSPLKTIERIGERKCISLAEGEQRLHDALQNALNSNDKDIHIIICPPGLGKTNELTRIGGVLIAEPTHRLKNDTAQRMRVPHMVTPQMPKFDDELFVTKFILTLF